MKVPAVGLLLSLLVGVFGVADAQITISPPAPPASQPRQIAREVGCAYSTLAAKVLGVPLCPNPPAGRIEVADTIPGTPGNPSSQVITVQGCTGCIGTGSGGGGGGSGAYTGVTANVYGQTGTAASFQGISGFDQINGNVDNITVAPFGGNTSGTGYPAAYGQPGVLVVQGGLQGGAIAVSGNLGGPYSGTVNGQTATTASFAGAGGLYNSTAPSLTSGQFSPFQVDSSGNERVTFPSPQPVTIASTAPVSIAGSVAVTGTFYPATQPVSIAAAPPLPYSLPITTPTPQAIVASSFLGIGGDDYSGNFNAAKVDLLGNQYVINGSLSGTTAAIGFSGASSAVITLNGASDLTFYTPGGLTGATITFQVGNDGTNYGTTNCINTTAGGNSSTTTATAAASFSCNVGNANYFRWNLTTTGTAGSTTFTYRLSSQPAYNFLQLSTGPLATGLGLADDQTIQTGLVVSSQNYISHVPSGPTAQPDTTKMDALRDSQSSSDGLNHSAGILATVQNSKGPSAPIGSDFIQGSIYNTYAGGTLPYTITAASTSKVIVNPGTVSGSASVYVNGYQLFIVGSGATAQLGYTTSTGIAVGATCTGFTALTPFYPAGIYNIGGAIGPLFRLPATNELCIQTGATGTYTSVDWIVNGSAY